MRPAPHLLSVWFDGLSPRAQVCELCIEGHELVLTLVGSERRYPLEQVRWAERRLHGQRQTSLPDGSLVQHADAAQWDAWRRDCGVPEAMVVGWTQSWRVAGVALCVIAVLCVAVWIWGVPWLRQTLAQQVLRSL